MFVVSNTQKDPTDFIARSDEYKGATCCLHPHFTQHSVDNDNGVWLFRTGQNAALQYCPLREACKCRSGQSGFREFWESVDQQMPQLYSRVVSPSWLQSVESSLSRHSAHWQRL